MSSKKNTSDNNKEQRRRERLKQEENRKKYEAAREKTRKISLVILGTVMLLSVIALIVMLAADAVYVHNTSMTTDGGREVAVSGSAFLKALFTGTYTSAEAGYDDISMPFYYYAKAWCTPAAIFALVCLIAIILAFAASATAFVFALLKKELEWTFLSLGASALLTVISIVFYAICLSMSGSQILPVYCSGNPACSIQSDLIWCVLLSGLSLAGNIFILVKYLLLEKQRKETEKVPA